MAVQSPFGGNVGARKRIEPVQVMTVNGLTVQLNMPKATESRYDALGQETTSRLAPYAKTEVVDVNDLPDAPADWVRSDPANGVGSFLAKAQPGHMVWLDLNGNGHHRHHVAALISAQGINALTGLKMEPPPRLEQYSEVCPLHGCRFEGDNHCPQCGFQWPRQNYIATTSCGSGAFWRDGFRGQDGKTREFIFVDDPARGVAANLIGDARVNAFGLALFTSKEPRPRPVYRGSPFLASHDGLLGGGLESYGSTSKGARRPARALAPEVGAGALVNQDVEGDKYRLDFWNQAPEAIFVIYYLGEAAYDELVGAAVQRPGSEGFLDGLPVGNKK